MTLGELQRAFTKLVGLLILYAYEHDFELTFGEAYRTPEQAALNAKKGIGIKNSLHCERLAIDLNLFKDGNFLIKTEDYRELGKFWESLATAEVKTMWGGRFKDGNHFSIKYQGRA
jgi:hypothetical protein